MTSRKLRIPCPGVVGGRYPPTYPIANTEVSSRGYSIAKSRSNCNVWTPDKSMN